MLLSIFDRFQIKKMLQEKERMLQGLAGFSLSGVHRALKLLDKVEFSDDEKAENNIREDKETNEVKWKEDAKDFEIDLSKNEVDFIKEMIENRKFWEFDPKNVGFAEKFVDKISYINDMEHLLHLNFFDRLTIRGLILAKKFSIDSLKDLKACLRVYRDIEISQEEIKEYNIAKNEANDLVWKKDYLKELILDSYEYDIIKRYIENSENYAYGLNKSIFGLMDKFEIEIKDEDEDEEGESDNE